MKNFRTAALALILLVDLALVDIGPFSPVSARAENASNPLGEPTLEPPTLQCLGVYWIIGGDDNKNAKVEFQYRTTGAAQWRRAMDLFRVEKGGNKLEKGESAIKTPSDGWLFAGSAVLLEPDTEYELKLSLSDPDGGAAEKLLKARTLAEPMQPKDAREMHVIPGAGGGSGTQADPFKGLAAAQAQAKPGDLFLLHKGVYEGTFEIKKNGEPGKPIIWRGAGDGEAVIDAQGKAPAPPDRGISASDIHDVWFEKLSIRKCVWGVVAHEGQRVVIRRCHFYDVKRGLTATRNNSGRLGGLFIADNLLEGPYTWADAKHGASVEEYRGIEISGSGNVVCYNRVRGFKDGIDMAPSPRCVASDVHNNEVSECLDDGCEMDGSERNNRCFLNRFTNVFQGISVQPVFGGPIYIFRNALYNIEVEAFKMHNSPSGALFLHNTCVKKGMPLVLSTSEKARNCVYRNNLFIGTDANYAYETTAPMADCDFDYDGFGGGPWGNFLKWNGARYKTLEEVKAKAPVYKHAVLVDPATLFASGIKQPEDPKKQTDPAANDLRLKAGSAAIDAGAILPGINDGFAGKAPDLGAYEFGAPLPHYGPRPEK
ncbi:MAG: right-handed parallel beta-helix repeat-containing protein [Candidatus Sumerlaeota bacterium]|nr:right-handed parallel beta-helix repeat-containing protein [Candidatus Sumerlaeota bacterium]